VDDKRFLLKLLAITTSFLYEAIAAIGVGFLMGWGIDRLVGLERVFVIVFMVLGAIAAVRNFMVRVYRIGVDKDD